MKATKFVDAVKEGKVLVGAMGREVELTNFLANVTGSVLSSVAKMDAAPAIALFLEKEDEVDEIKINGDLYDIIWGGDNEVTVIRFDNDNYLALTVLEQEGE